MTHTLREREDMPTLPTFRYHPDPVRSGSVEPSDARCDVCGEARGFVYSGPVYSEQDEPVICPWCIADGSAAEELDATFVDGEAFGDEIPEEVMDEIMTRTPGYAAWQSEVWPGCCGDATVFEEPIGFAEVRRDRRELEGLLMEHVVHVMGISGGAATRLVEALHRDRSPTAYVFHCAKCRRPHLHVDQT